MYEGVIYDKIHISIACEYEKKHTATLTNARVIEHIHMHEVLFLSKNNIHK